MSFLCFCQLTAILVLGVEDVAAPLSQVGQHAEHSLDAELREAGCRLLAVSSSFISSLPFGQHGQHLLRHLAAVASSHQTKREARKRRQSTRAWCWTANLETVLG